MGVSVGLVATRLPLFPGGYATVRSTAGRRGRHVPADPFEPS